MEVLNSVHLMQLCYLHFTANTVPVAVAHRLQPPKRQGKDMSLLSNLQGKL